MKKRALFLFTCCILLTGAGLFTGCGRHASETEDANLMKDTDLMKDISANKKTGENIQSIDLNGYGAEAVTDFGVRLLQNTITDGKNTLISPLSVISALGMTQNGAREATKEQMEQVLGMPCEELNAYLSAFVQALPSSDKYKLSSANSIWLKDDGNFTVKQDFLQTNADWYGAGIYKDAFDSSTIKRVNQWVKENTDEMIPEILTKIPDDAVMYLITALAFEAEWETIYFDTQVNEETFTAEDGTEQKVDFMHSEEYKYLEDGQASGFFKYYADNKYAFAALLPGKDTDINDYAASLTGKKLHDLLSNPKDITVYASLPKFTSQYSAKLKPVLKTLGMTDAFSPELSDFSGLGSYTDGNIYINEVFHKTFIAVDERGTKAGAAAMVEMMAETALMETKTVTLNRPFVYMLVDCATNVPVFMGVVKSIDE